ncbi:MAG: PQQ-binding-like beta-propeller repeat protein [Pirellulales bacterium]|nr:PQQ-binding-like beta-propeller repeat protein [Pirellulales bacterium]
MPRRLIALAVLGFAGLALAGLAAVVWLRGDAVSEIAASKSRAAQWPAPAPAETDWPWWRGVHANNIVGPGSPPTIWSASENVIWRVAVPGRGHASPTVWGDRIFIATADDSQQTQSLLCFDRETGQQRWEKLIRRGGFQESHQKNSHASPTPACDGRHVYTVFAAAGSIWVTATDFDGRQLWQTEAGPFIGKFGYGSAPAIHESLVIVAGDNRGSKLGRFLETSFLAALDRATGQIVWRIKRPNENSCGTPIVATVAGKPQLLLSGNRQVCGYNPLDGSLLWRCGWTVDRSAGTVAFGPRLVYASGTTRSKELVAIAADGHGDISSTGVVWRTTKGAADVPTPLLYDDLLYVIDDLGVATCYDALSGKTVWAKRLGGNFSSSPMLAGGHIYVANEDGVTFVFKPGRAYEAVAQNDLGEAMFATPAFCGDRVYARTLHHLWCLGTAAPQAAALPTNLSQ